MILAPAVQLTCAVAAAGFGVAGALLLPAAHPTGGGAGPSMVAFALAGAAAAVVATVAFCRRHVARAIARATDASEQARQDAVGTASAHAAQVQAILETATEGIVTIDAVGTITTFNGAAERLFEYSARETIGQNVTLLMPRPFAEEHGGYLKRYLETGDKRIIGVGREVVGRRKDGALFPIDLSVGEGWTNGQRFFTAVIRDITERHDMQAKLTQAERLAAVGELAAGIAHEVNNPINTMINCAQLIIDGDDPAENGQVILEEGQRIAEIVRDLLQFARDDRDRPQATSLNEAVQRTLRLMAENFKRHGIGLEVDVADNLPLVMARPQQVQQVLLNMLINAKDALQQRSEGKHVCIRAVADKNEAGLIVSDNGPGIPPELGNRVFEPFVTTKRAKGGTGLGLSISKSIIEGYGGRIELDSAPGRGAEFRIWLPLAERAEA